MDSDAFIRSGMRALVEDAHVPEVSLDAIHRKMRGVPAVHRMPTTGWLAIAATLLLIVVPLSSRSVVLSLQQRIAQFMRWSPPPPPPKSLTQEMKVETVTLDEARSKVSFAIVEPAGLPADIASSKIMLIPVAVYGETKTWHRSANQVAFSYTRNDGRTFEIMASAYDPKTAGPGKYMFNADELDAKGMPKRYDVVAWRNGEEMMSVVAHGISVTEIDAIRDAMHGTPIRPGAQVRSLQYMKIGKP